MKANAACDPTERRDQPQGRNILADDIILFSAQLSQVKCPHRLSRIVVWDEKNLREIVLLTNHPTFGGTTIADIYKERWRIELFFKLIKRDLRIQIWTAMIDLLLKWLHHLSKADGSLPKLASLLRLNLFTYRDLRSWLNDPYNTPPHIPPCVE